MEKPRIEPSKARTLVYEFIIQYITENGFPPTVREIGDGVGMKSSSTVYGLLMVLHNMGLIKVESRKPRAIKVNGYEFRKINV